MPAAFDPDRVGRAVAAGLAAFEARHPACRAAHERGRQSMPNGVAMSWFATLYGHPPLVVVEGDGHRFTCSDGLTYLDMGLAIISVFAGHRHPAIFTAVEGQLRRGTQFTMSGPDDARLTEELARRWGLPAWQLTLSATAAVSEGIRAARAMTGRTDVLAFEGKYHGFHDELLVLADGGRLVPEYLGLAPGAGLATRLVPFNDLAAAAAALADGRVAAAIVEPAILNTRTILPEPDFHAGLRRLTRDAGALLIVDETYTLTMAVGGLTRAWGLEPDIVTLGKSLGGGIPLGAWGMTDSVRRFLEAPAGAPIGFGDVQFVGRPIGEVGTGSTFAGNALSVAAGIAMLEEVLTVETYARTAALARRLADGLRALVVARALPWGVVEIANRAGIWWTGEPPRDAAAVMRDEDPALTDAVRLGMLERGVFDAGGWSHPTIGARHTEADVDAYLAALDDVIAELART